MANEKKAEQQTAVRTTSELDVEEYHALREEIAASVAETRMLERYAVVGSATVWAWILVQTHQHGWIDIAKILPVVLTCFAAFRAWAVFVSLMHIAQYIRTLEDSGRYGICWETFLRKKHRYILLLSAIVFWAALLSLNLFLACRLDSFWLNAQKPC
jgi:hypothetical protein